MDETVSNRAQGDEYDGGAATQPAPGGVPGPGAAPVPAMAAGPGWYPDPEGSNQPRWWDGQQWWPVGAGELPAQLVPVQQAAAARAPGRTRARRGLVMTGVALVVAAGVAAGVGTNRLTSAATVGASAMFAEAVTVAAGGSEGYTVELDSGASGKVTIFAPAEEGAGGTVDRPVDEITVTGPDGRDVALGEPMFPTPYVGDEYDEDPPVAVAEFSAEEGGEYQIRNDSSDEVVVGADIFSTVVGGGAVTDSITGVALLGLSTFLGLAGAVLFVVGLVWRRPAEQA